MKNTNYEKQAKQETGEKNMAYYTRFKRLRACSNALDFVYHTTFDLYTLQSRVRLNTLYSAHYKRFDKSNRV